jgi:hypothetical protein
MGRSGFLRPAFCLCHLLIPFLGLVFVCSAYSFAPDSLTCRAFHNRPAATLHSRMSVKVGAESSERFGHVFAAEAEANVSRLIVNRARQE